MRSNLLKQSEQVVVGLLLISALATIAGYWGLRAWHRHDLIEFDQAVPLEATFRIDINQANWPELMQLPGIGETTARSIVQTRKASGPFKSVADLQARVHGVGPRMTEQIGPFLLPLHAPASTRSEQLKP